MDDRRNVRRQDLWAYIGHPAEETPARRGVLYAIVVLRIGLGATFLLLGREAVFGSPSGAFAARLGSTGRWGLESPLAADMAAFILGCTELLVGAFQLLGAFTRLTAATGIVLSAAYLVLGSRAGLAGAAYPAIIGSLVLVVVCGSPFLSVDRFLDKVEEEERDRAPVALPGTATAAPLAPRLGLAASLLLLLWPSIDGSAGSDPQSTTLRGVLVLMATLLVAGVLTRAVGLLVSIVVAGIVMSASNGSVLAGGIVAAGVALAITGGGSAALRWRGRERVSSRTVRKALWKRAR